MFNITEIVSGVIIEKRSANNPTWRIVKSLTSSMAFTCNELESFSWFLFRVKALNVLGTSEPSKTLNITTLEGGKV